ncbi:MAG: aldo/keto reductase [Acidobacteriota bacterium]|nr:aldo/keto reductase [Acidobacteriota bacterium]
MGKGLEGKRDKVFLMTKVCTHERDKQLAMRMLEESLRRLRTDHLDIWQVHEVIHDNDPDLIFAKGGAIKALDEAKKQGKVHPFENAVARLSVRYRADAAELFRRHLQELRASGATGVESGVTLCHKLAVATTISGMESVDVPHQNLQVARGFTAATPKELSELRDRCADVRRRRPVR